MSVLSKLSWPGNHRQKNLLQSQSQPNLSLVNSDPYAVAASSSPMSEQAAVHPTHDASLGTLIVVVMKAKNLYNRRAISKQNPYCTVRVAKHSDRTASITRGGQAPVWDHETRFKLSVEDDNRVLKLCVFDQNGSNTEIIGDTSVSLKPALTKPPTVGYDDWFPIYYNQKYMGEVYLEMTFYPSKRHSRHSSHKSVSSLHTPRALPEQPQTLTLSNGLVPARSASPLQNLSPTSSSSRFNTLNRANPALMSMKHSESMPMLVPDSLVPHPHSHSEPHITPSGHSPRSSASLLGRPSLSPRPLPRLPTEHTDHPAVIAKAQDDIFRQINDGYEASLLEKLRP